MTRRAQDTRRSRFPVTILAAIIVVAAAHSITLSQSKHEAKPMSVTVGTTAPPFTLYDTERKPRSLQEFRGKKVVIAFYPGAFTGACTKEVCALQDALATFNSFNAQVIGISIDSPFANKAFSDANKLAFPLLSDYSREISKAYVGLYEDFAGVKGYTAAKRSVFILDEKGVVTYVWVTDAPATEPPYEELKAALK